MIIMNSAQTACVNEARVMHYGHDKLRHAPWMDGWMEKRRDYQVAKNITSEIDPKLLRKGQ
jgi:hypothetical protein